MAQDPGGLYDPQDEDFVDTSHQLDLVALYSSVTVDAGIEADIIRGILDSHGISSLVRRAAGYPSLGFEVQVHRQDLEEARRLIEEAKAAGPAAAMDAERNSEESS